MTSASHPASEAEVNSALRAQIRGWEQRVRDLEASLRSARARLEDQKAVLEGYARGPFTRALVVGDGDALASGSLEGSARRVLVSLNGRVLLLPVAAQLEREAVPVGAQVLVSAQMVVVAVLAGTPGGAVLNVSEIAGPGQILASAPGGGSLLLQASAELVAQVKVGSSVLADPSCGVALRLVEQGRVEQLFSPEVPRVLYSEIGGLGPQIEKIRDAVELPFTHPELYRRYGLRPPKGILLYGPPGCGKTLIAKAVATSLGRALPGRQSAYFLSVKGPELLSRFVGESERQIRMLFSRARELAESSRPVVIFFDEMEALFRLRGSGVSSDVERTVVPQLLAEIDGVEQLDNVILIGASNREDMLDPAVTRPGRLDVKVHIDRPDVEAAGEIFAIHLGLSTPLAPCVLGSRETGEVARGATEGAGRSRLLLRAHLQKRLSERHARTALYRVWLVGGGQVDLFVGDLLSGALVASIVERAKKEAIKAHLLAPAALQGLSVEHLDAAIDTEIQEMRQLRPALDGQQWARLLGLDSALVERVQPLR